MAKKKATAKKSTATQHSSTLSVFYTSLGCSGTKSEPAVGHDVHHLKTQP